MGEKRITYLLGAGASYYACPIWNLQGEKMLEMAMTYLDKETDFPPLNPYKLSQEEERSKYLLYEIGYFGSKAKEFGTIDTYAKKLYLNGKVEELARLKMAVSVFFSVWESIDNPGLKSLDAGKFQYSGIDNRYKALLAAITVKKERQTAIRSNINVVTWNYDLQFERAFKLFCQNNTEWNEVEDFLPFRVDKELPLRVCHLNGHHGYYTTRQRSGQSEEITKVRNYLDRSDSNNIEAFVNDIDYIGQSLGRGELHFENHINYAWEENDFAKKARNRAVEIFSETDTLVIVGYSFPSFNKEIDKLLFAQLRNRNVEVYYQDPNASPVIIESLINSPKAIIKSETKTNNFFLPHDF